MQELKPQLDAISKKHKDDKKKQQEEQLKLYQQHGINPAGGCLFALIQLPVFISLYRVIFQFVEAKNAKAAIAAINKEAYIPAIKISQINPAFFGFDLTATPSQFSKLGIYYLAIPIITGILQYLQVSLATPATAAPVKKEKGKKDEEDMQTAMSSQMKLIFPLMIGYFSYSLPVGLSLYWNIFSIFSIIQYRKKAAASLTVAKKEK
jgi:YidC/Oxa1 family membrane protein insertase